MASLVEKGHWSDGAGLGQAEAKLTSRIIRVGFLVAFVGLLALEGWLLWRVWGLF